MTDAPPAVSPDAALDPAREPGQADYQRAVDAYVVGDFDGALTGFAAALAAQPTLAAAAYGAAMIWMTLGQVDAAWASIEQAIAIAPDEPAWWSARARIALGLGDGARALAAIDDADARGGEPIELHGLRGTALAQLGRLPEARAAYAEARALGPDRYETHFNCALGAELAGDLDGAIAGYGATLAVDPTVQAAWANLTRILTALGRRAELAEVYARWHAQVPDDPAVAHLLASARGDNPPAAPAAYLTQLFDHAAAGYDHLMVAQLDYRAPALIGAALDGVGVTRVGVALDLGCGTGLCGAVVGPRAARLVGVDLSAQMTAIAATTGRYDALEVGDALAHLATAAPYDLIVAADVLVYLGDLAPVAAAVRRALAPGGHWAFTVEDGGEAGYALGPVGRYAHHRAYVAEVLAAAGLTAIVDTPGVLRREGDAEVAGRVWVARAG